MRVLAPLYPSYEGMNKLHGQGFLDAGTADLMKMTVTLLGALHMVMGPVTACIHHQVLQKDRCLRGEAVALSLVRDLSQELSVEPSQLSDS